MSITHARRWFLTRIFYLSALAICLTGCSSETTGNQPGGDTLGRDPSRGERPIQVVCTTAMVADLVRNVGGSWVVVEALMGEGVDPHLYKASTGDVQKLDSADVIFYSGLHLEGKMGDLFVRLARRKPTYAVTESVPEDKLLEIGEGQYDPHIWFDVALWAETLAVVRDALSEIDPLHRDAFAAAAARYRSELLELDAQCRAELSTIPAERRVLVTAHDAFGYFGRAYALQVKAIQGISTESEAGVREINELVEYLTLRRIKAVFIESSVSDRNIQALVEGCRARKHAVEIGGSLYSDAMGPSGTPAGTYVGMVRANVATIVAALQ